MKTLNVSAQIERFSAVRGSNGEPLFRNGREITHRLILLTSASFETAIKAAAQLKRKPEADGSMKVSSFCLKRDDGKYAIDLNAQQVALLTGGRMSPQQFAFVAKGSTFNAVIELRELGDTVVDRRTGETITIGEAATGNAHAAIRDLSSTLLPHVEARITMAMFQPTDHAVLATTAITGSSQTSSAEVVREVSGDAAAENLELEVADATAAEISKAGAAKATAKPYAGSKVPGVGPAPTSPEEAPQIGATK